MIEYAKFLEIIKLLETNYDKKIPNSIVKIWYDEFKDYDVDKFKTLIIESIKKYQFFPTINQVKDNLNTIIYESV